MCIILSLTHFQALEREAVQLQAVGGNLLHADFGSVWCTRGQCLLTVLDGDNQVSIVKMTWDSFKTK